MRLAEGREGMEKGFEAWRSKVDALCWKRFVLSIDDLPDCPLVDWYEDGFSPIEALRKAKRFAEGDE